MRGWCLLPIVFLVPVMLGGLAGGDQPVRPIVVGPEPSCRDAAVPDGWESFRFRGRTPTRYRMTEEAGVSALEASADRSASILYTHVSSPVEDRPILSWRWGIQRTPRGADIFEERTDDAVARLFVAFEYRRELIPRGQRFRYWLARVAHGEYPPYAALCYVWSRTQPVGTVRVHPEYCRLVQIVIRSGDRAAGQWTRETRNVLADYSSVFGAAPPPVSHIAVMTDTDDTGDTLKAWYGAIALHSARSITRRPAPACAAPRTPPCTGSRDR